jgi:hypothetical protein
MKNRAAVIFLLFFLATPLWGEEGHVAVVKSVEGEVTIVRQDERIAATPGMLLYTADKVISGSGASGGITFIDGTLLSVGPSTELDIQNYQFEPSEKQYDFSLYMKKGQAVYSSGRLGKLAPESVKVKTPRATLGVRGTRFIVAVN